jgi:hypothetical protein
MEKRSPRCSRWSAQALEEPVTAAGGTTARPGRHRGTADAPHDSAAPPG